MRLHALLLAALGSLAGALPATAGNFTVSPVRIQLTPAKPLSSLTITNDADTPVSIEVRASAWSQADGEDQYEDTRELLVTPPVFSLAPGASQIVRLGLRRSADPKTELAYRVFLTEVKSATQSETTGVTMNLRLAVPVFVHPVDNNAAPVVEWQATRGQDGSLTLRAQNNGTMHLQLANLRVLAGATELGRAESAAYLLPGQAHEWNISPDAGKSFDAPALELNAYSDAGDVKIPLTLR
jgi:fimbrial chaperone protein